MPDHPAAAAARLPALRGRRGRSRRWRAAILEGGGWTLSGLALFVLLFPILVMLSTSLKTLNDVYRVPPSWVPAPLTLQNFADIWTRYPLGTYMRNSLIIGVGATLLNLAAAIPAGYAVARLRFRGRETFMLLLLLIQMSSPIVVRNPLFKIMAALHWLDTYHPITDTSTLLPPAFPRRGLPTALHPLPLERHARAPVHE